MTPVVRAEFVKAHRDGVNLEEMFDQCLRARPQDCLCQSRTGAAASGFFPVFDTKNATPLSASPRGHGSVEQHLVAGHRRQRGAEDERKSRWRGFLLRACSLSTDRAYDIAYARKVTETFMARDDLGRWVPGGNDISPPVSGGRRQRAPTSRRRQRRRRRATTRRSHTFGRRARHKTPPPPPPPPRRLTASAASRE